MIMYCFILNDNIVSCNHAKCLEHHWESIGYGQNYRPMDQDRRENQSIDIVYEI